MTFPKLSNAPHSPGRAAYLEQLSEEGAARGEDHAVGLQLAAVACQRDVHKVLVDAQRVERAGDVDVVVVPFQTELLRASGHVPSSVVTAAAAAAVVRYDPAAPVTWVERGERVKSLLVMVDIRVGNRFKSWFKPAEIMCIYATGWQNLYFPWLKLVKTTSWHASGQHKSNLSQLFPTLVNK